MLSKSLTFSYGGTKYCVKTQGPGTSMRGGKVMVHQFADGRLRFSYKERALTCRAYGTYAMPDPAEDEKTLDVRVEAIIAVQRTSKAQRDWRPASPAVSLPGLIEADVLALRPQGRFAPQERWPSSHP